MSGTRWFGPVLALVAGWGFAVAAIAQPSLGSEGVAGQQHAPLTAAREAEHDRIRQEREVLNVRRQRDESVCYRRFMVEDCLRGVRAQARDDEARLRVREIELNDAERKEKAAARLKSIEEKQRAAPQGVGAQGPVLRRALPEPKAEKVLRDSQAARESAEFERAARARVRHAQRLEAAQQRRERVAQSEAEAALQGRKRPAPLPTGSAVVSP